MASEQDYENMSHLLENVLGGLFQGPSQGGASCQPDGPDMWRRMMSDLFQPEGDQCHQDGETSRGHRCHQDGATSQDQAEMWRRMMSGFSQPSGNQSQCHQDEEATSQRQQERQEGATSHDYRAQQAEMWRRMMSGFFKHRQNEATSQGDQCCNEEAKSQGEQPKSQGEQAKSQGEQAKPRHQDQAEMCKRMMSGFFRGHGCHQNEEAASEGDQHHKEEEATSPDDSAEMWRRMMSGPQGSRPRCNANGQDAPAGLPPFLRGLGHVFARCRDHQTKPQTWDVVVDVSGMDLDTIEIQADDVEGKMVVRGKLLTSQDEVSKRVQLPEGVIKSSIRFYFSSDDLHIAGLKKDEQTPKKDEPKTTEDASKSDGETSQGEQTKSRHEDEAEMCRRMMSGFFGGHGCHQNEEATSPDDPAEMWRRMMSGPQGRPRCNANGQDAQAGLPPFLQGLRHVFARCRDRQTKPQSWDVVVDVSGMDLDTIEIQADDVEGKMVVQGKLLTSQDEVSKRVQLPEGVITCSVRCYLSGDDLHISGLKTDEPTPKKKKVPTATLR